MSKEARFLRVIAPVLALFIFMGADYASPNFIIKNAPSPELAKKFSETAEQSRREMAILWLGKEMPDWTRPCPIVVKVGENLGAGGMTSMRFNNGHVFDWDMEIQGSAARIIDSVIPHEITHMVLASHFRKPVPRWIDEGAATSVEHESEKTNYRKMLLHFLREDIKRGIPFNRMVALEKYPDDAMPLYAQGFSIAEMLISKGGHRRFVEFAGYAMETGDWGYAVNKFYGHKDLNVFQREWVAWVGSGSPLFDPQESDVMLAANVTAEPLNSPELPDLTIPSDRFGDEDLVVIAKEPEIPPYTSLASSSFKKASPATESRQSVILEWGRDQDERITR